MSPYILFKPGSNTKQSQKFRGKKVFNINHIIYAIEMISIKIL